MADSPAEVDPQKKPNRLSFFILGSPRVRDGATLPIAEPWSGTLLTALAVRANTPVSMADLAAALWLRRIAQPAMPVGAAVAALRRTLALPGARLEDRITQVGQAFRLTVEPDELDLDRFTILLRQGRAALDAEDHHAAAHLPFPGTDQHLLAPPSVRFARSSRNGGTR